MTTFSRNLRLTAIALCAWGASVFAAEKPAAAEAAKDAAKAAADAKKDEAKASQQSLLEQAEKQRKGFIQDHETLLKQLNSATAEDQKKAILDKMKEREKEFQDKLNDLHRQLRDEERRQRQNGARK